MYALPVWAALPGLFSSSGDPAKMRTELEEGSGPLVDDCVLLRGSSSLLNSYSYGASLHVTFSSFGLPLQYCGPKYENTTSRRLGASLQALLSVSLSSSWLILQYCDPK